MLRNIKMKAKFMTVFLAVGIIPFITIAVSYTHLTLPTKA